jgi:hypothetical protein
MLGLTRIASAGRLLSLPETRRLILQAVRSPSVRRFATASRHDRAALMLALARPATARSYLGAAVRHPATHELASASLLFLPERYLPAGWVATWAVRRLLGRSRGAMRARSRD